jgi:DNA polymerase-3 subunit beta
MELTALKSDLMKASQVTQNIISTQSTLPILSNMLLEAKKDMIKIVTTDLDIGISYLFKADVINEGVITIPAKKFSDIIKELPNEEVKIVVKKNNAVEVRSGVSYFKLMGISKDEYPKLPAFTNKEFVTLSQVKLKKMLEMSLFAVSKDETRYVLNGILIEIKDNNIKTVATDGRRLNLIETRVELPQKINKKIIIPAKTTQELVRNLNQAGDVRIVFSDNQVCFEFDNTLLTTRLIEGEFPDYKKVIPGEIKEKVRVNKNNLMKAIKRVALFTNIDSIAIKMDIMKDKIVLSKSTPDLGEARDEVVAEYEGRELSIGFNPNYLLDILKVVSDETIDIEVVDPQKPAVIREKDKYVFIVLPMQLI